MNHKSLLSILFSALLGCYCTTAAAQADLTCQQDSGIWNGSALDGALCNLKGESPDFYRFDSASGKGQFAPLIPNVSEQFHFLLASPKVLFYADDDAVYAVEREHFKVLYHLNWQEALTLSQDPEDPGHKLVMTRTEKGRKLHLIRPGEHLDEEMTADFGDALPLDVVWQQKRLVVIERNRLIYWPRPGVEIPAVLTEPVTEARVPVSWKEPPVIVPMPSELVDGDYVLDPNGLMILNRDAKKLSYFRFNTNTWTTASINATASIQGLGRGPLYAMGVTIDANTVRIVARLGVFLINRFEIKYWKLPSNPDTPVVIGQDDIAALDGGVNNRIQTIDTTEMTWKRLAQIQLDAPGRMAELQNDELITIHETGTDALVIWNARTGQKLLSLSSDKFSDFGPIASVQTISKDMQRYKLITGRNGMFLIFDRKTGTLSAPQPFVKKPLSELPAGMTILENGIIVQAPNGQQYDFYPADETQNVSMRTLSAFTPEKCIEMQTPQEKWYGYCLTPDDCYVPLMMQPEQVRKTPDVTIGSAAPSHAPNWISWLLCALAFIAMFAVMLWRTGFGKKSLLKTETDQNSSTSSPDIFDEKNRRYITDRDNRYFLETSRFSTAPFRLGLSILLGLTVGIAVAIRYFLDDTFLTFLSWITVLAMPVTAIVWIISSWHYWNRFYLLRFGCLTEGKWLNCAQTNPSVVYEPVPGTTYELGRSQWTRVDFVPMVLFDPARPRFAIQYTGGCSHTVVQNGPMEEKPSSACTYDIFRLAMVAGLLVATIVSTQFLFQYAYPDSLSAWKLDSLTADSMKEDAPQTFAMACLDACDEGDTTCFTQCHQRQFRLVLEDAGIPMPYDPITTASEYLSDYRNKIASARSILLENQTLSCDDREARIAAIELWPDEVAKAFWSVYADPDTFDVTGLGEIFNDIVDDADELNAMCDEFETCPKALETCPAPPTCPGAINTLKMRVCAFQNAIFIPDLTDSNETAQTGETQCNSEDSTVCLPSEIENNTLVD